MEVVDHSRPDRWVVASGFGNRAQWFRNVSSDPRVRLFIGSHQPAPATAVRLDGPAAATTLGRYAAAHPRAWARLRPVLQETLDTRIDETRTELPLIAFDTGRSPSH